MDYFVVGNPSQGSSLVIDDEVRGVHDHIIAKASLWWPVSDDSKVRERCGEAALGQRALAMYLAHLPRANYAEDQVVIYGRHASRQARQQSLVSYVSDREGSMYAERIARRHEAIAIGSESRSLTKHLACRDRERLRNGHLLSLCLSWTAECGFHRHRIYPRSLDDWASHRTWEAQPSRKPLSHGTAIGYSGRLVVGIVLCVTAFFLPIGGPSPTAASTNPYPPHKGAEISITVQHLKSSQRGYSWDVNADQTGSCTNVGQTYQVVATVQGQLHPCNIQPTFRTPL